MEPWNAEYIKALFSELAEIIDVPIICILTKKET